MATYLITGANRGIGLELTKQLLDLQEAQVSKIIAFVRNSSSGLDDLASKSPDRLAVVTADTSSSEGIKTAVADVEKALQGKGLDCLVNNAATLPIGPDKMEDVPIEQMTEAFNVNVVKIQIMISTFLPLLRKGKEKKIIGISSSLGSTTWALKWPMGFCQAYRMSKAALGMLNALYAGDLKDEGFTCLLLSPGWLKTNDVNQWAHLETEVGVAEVKRIILEANPSQNGQFRNIHIPDWHSTDRPDHYDGLEIPY
ncbi:Estradiol 17-beta-dehydrogenase 2 [Pseudocercospora fuligena]|uniref:Estradiol 17-beta-dehydrogenase 2 n=1 Tax=Pseudocercospora fuligena TaxID=685502 RepID=A0A8H6R9R4_9PEZI|nr:Estradiol 17-beta-dehydrogenase 2 [Pseudocercospora fuligena]